MKYFTPIWHESGCPPVPDYEARFRAIRDRLPEVIDDRFSLHDARIKRVQILERGYACEDIALHLDTRHSLTKAKRILFTGAKFKMEGSIANSRWIAEEFELAQHGYRMAAMTLNAETQQYGFLTVTFKDIQIA